MDIEVVVVPDCPHEQPAVELMRRALDDMGLHDVRFGTRVISDHHEAERAAFTGSPTFLLDGRDPFAEPGGAPGLACRIYRTPSGLAGLPTPGQLRQALEAAAGDEPGP
ncbi:MULTISPECIES: hypothetical protein [unclassified Streptomyces]|uniref:hypothetical protein n=1 Tax=unclassified Streptomyces TaxID=2593676 RepID=UPI000DC7810E|nr:MULTISPECIES: hypothetical protein [unclassified Streptomyces]AWZ08587.1 hypothetical protein DRB89_32930 [Streptomyces sp. ICC4]AWZ13275.1 hypothetical protein DRB96_14180 [Streptomyces sp. ICC1]